MCTSTTACSGFTTLTLALRKAVKMAFCMASCVSGGREDRFWNVTERAEGDPSRDRIRRANSEAAAGSDDRSCGAAEAAARHKNRSAQNRRLNAVFNMSGKRIVTFNLTGKHLKWQSGKHLLNHLLHGRTTHRLMTLPRVIKK